MHNQANSHFMTPPNHVNYQAKKLFGAVGEIIDGSIANITLQGGGPTEQHTHEHNHLFIVTEGEAKVLLRRRNGPYPKGRSLPCAGQNPALRLEQPRRTDGDDRHLRAVMGIK